MKAHHYTNLVEGDCTIKEDVLIKALRYLVEINLNILGSIRTAVTFS